MPEWCGNFGTDTCPAYSKSRVSDQDSANFERRGWYPECLLYDSR
jgi:hypothetical protein